MFFRVCVAEVLTSGPKEPVHSVSYRTVTYIYARSVSLKLLSWLRKLLVVVIQILRLLVKARKSRALVKLGLYKI